MGVKRVLIPALAALFLLPGGCYEPKRTGIKPPCGSEGVSRVDLGIPRRYDSSSLYAEFTTNGGLLYVTAYGFSHGGVLDPDVGHTSIYIGPGSPEGENAEPSNALASLSLTEDDYSTVELPVGTYWLVGGPIIEIVSCEEGGVSDGKPVIPAFPAERTNIKPPCGDQGVSRVDLGTPWYNPLDRYQDLSSYAEFTTNGGPLYLTATGFAHSADRDSDLAQTTISMGLGVPRRHINELPIWNIIEQVDLLEGDFIEIRLDPGTYWLLSESPADIAIVSCQEGGVSVVEGVQ